MASPPFFCCTLHSKITCLLTKDYVSFEQLDPWLMIRKVLDDDFGNLCANLFFSRNISTHDLIGSKKITIFDKQFGEG